MSSLEGFEFFLEVICPPFMLFIGIFGNIVIVAVLSRKKFRHNTSRNFLRVLAVNEMIAILTIVPYHGTAFNINLLYLNDAACKAFSYLAYTFPAVSSWLLVYINIERLATIKPYRAVANLFQKKWFQTVILVIIFFWNSAANIGRLFVELVTETEE